MEVAYSPKNEKLNLIATHSMGSKAKPFISSKDLDDYSKTHKPFATIKFDEDLKVFPIYF